MGFEIFMLEVSKYSSKQWQSVAILPPDTRKYRVEGLKSNRRYDFRVRGCVVPLGCSDYSATHVVVTLVPGRTKRFVLLFLLSCFMS